MHLKSTQTAFAAMSLLAEAYDGGKTLLTVAHIARKRRLHRPFLAKVMTSLVQAGLVRGSRGPGGGFTLTRHPKQITLVEVHRLFEGPAKQDACPFGHGKCGVGSNCALHDRFKRVRDSMHRVMRTTTFNEFRKARKSR